MVVNSYREMMESLGGAAAFPQGVSMRPLIKQGKGYVLIESKVEPQIGDIVLFEHMRQGQKKNILHRLIEIRPNGTYVCRGDNCLNCEYIRREDIIGRASQVCWTKESRSLMPHLLGAKRDAQNGGYVVSVTSPGYLRYVGFWNGIWTIRKPYYSFRIGVRSRLSKIGWLKRIYHKVKRR